MPSASSIARIRLSAIDVSGVPPQAFFVSGTLASMSRSSSAAAVAALLAGAIALLSLGSERAEACGVFLPTALSEKRRPSLAHEQAIILYDRESQTEHFIREVMFRQGTEAFGFVVPTPTRPEVAAVAKSPFSEFRRSFNFGSPPVAAGVSGSGTRDGRSGGGASSGVTLLDVVKVGSFTAFVLAASDAHGLSEWLAKQKLVKTPEAEAWLAHYVSVGFYFVAMRYEPKPEPPGTKLAEAGSAKAETMRISFRTMAPYYPYFEPDRRAPQNELRLLDLWVATDGWFEPASVLERDGMRRWVRPFRPGDRYEHAGPTLTAALGPELLGLVPQGDLVVATYQDQKVSRRGFGDVVFISERPTPPSRGDDNGFYQLFSVLDPELQGTGRKP
jgi:hypothetical protein